MRHLLSCLAVGAVSVLVVTGCASGAPHSAAHSRTAATTGAPTPSRAPVVTAADRAATGRSLAALEREYDATVGVVATDTTTGETLSYHGDRRFGYASTLKVFAVGEFLRSVHGSERAARVHWSAADIARAGYSPETGQHVADGLTYSQLAEAAVRQSDNTALNLVLERIGGPKALDEALSGLGDATTQVVHDEPELNTIEPGSTDDTTTPAAFTASLATLLNGRTLDASDTALLERWMSGNATGDTLVRAGAPAGWTVADKSGGAGGIRNDIARVARPGEGPIVLSVLTTKNHPDAAYDDALVAKTASAVLAAFDTGH